MEINGRTEIYGIIGWPVEHTRSPVLHNAAFGRLGMNAVYITMPVRPENLKAAIEGVRALGIKGINVTVPHKVEVLEYLDRMEGVAAELNAVNVVVNRDGELTGYNTDVEGFRLSLEKAGVDAGGAGVVVLGAGGASRSVIRALQIAGAEKIYVFNRTHGKAVGVAAELSRFGTGVTPVGFKDPGVDVIYNGCSIIINTTSLGLKAGDPIPVDAGMIKSEHTLVDLIYGRGETPFLAAGSEAGAKTVDGYGMLVFQAFEAFRLWTGRVPPLDVMWEAGVGRDN